MSSPWNARVLTVAGLAATIALAAQPASLRASPGPRRADAGQIAAQTPPPPATPSADYNSIDDARMDGRRAIGRTALLTMWRGNTAPDSLDAYPCEGAPGLPSVRLAYPAALRDYVRAMPTGSSHCARVHFRITGRQRFGDGLTGTVLAILDVEPLAPEAPQAAGVDFTNIDDVNMAGARARHRVAALSVYRGDTNDRQFTAHLCGEHGGIQFIRVNYRAADRERVRVLPTTSVDGCQTVQMRLQRQDFMNIWTADFLPGASGQ